MTPPARDRFLAALKHALDGGMLTKLTLGKYRGTEVGLRNVFARPVTLKSGPHLSLVWRYQTRDVTKNIPWSEAWTLLPSLIGGDFLDAHLFTPAQTAQFESTPDGRARVSIRVATVAPTAATEGHDRVKQRPLDATAGWLHDLGVTNPQGQPRAGQAAKLRQIQKFAELLGHLLHEAGLDDDRPLQVADMGSGKGYLTFATAALLGSRATVQGFERRHELVDTCTRVARAHGFTNLTFTAADIEAAPVEQLDVLLALHACNTATDEALARGVEAGATLLVVSPCCHQELRPQLSAPPLLAPVLRHGIFLERQAEFVTDALRALALEAAGYRTRILEFVSTEHTAKNLMIAAIRGERGGDGAARRQLTELASAYGIREQRLAQRLGLSLEA